MEDAIPKVSKPNFFQALFGNKQPEPESVSSLPKFILEKAKENIYKPNQPLANQVDSPFENEAHSFQRETCQAPARNLQMSLDDWYRFLKDWKRNEEERRKQERAKERLRLREEHLRLERQKEERLKKEQ